MDDMIERYGEVCTRQTAMKILSVAPKTMYNMLHDGRLDFACGDTMVDVRSICRFIESGRSRVGRGFQWRTDK